MEHSLVSNIEQLNAHPVIRGLPDATALPDCSTYATYRPIIMAAVPLITRFVPKAGAALQFLVGLADSVCNVSADTKAAPQDMRRLLAETILNKAALDPEWKAQLLSDPEAALTNSGIGQEFALLKQAGALEPLTADCCCISCIIST